VNVSEKLRRELSFYPGQPMLNQAIAKLELALDLMVDVELLLKNNWMRAQGEESELIQTEISELVLTLKRRRERDGWAR